MSKPAVCAVVITFQPDLDVLHRLLSSVMPQVENVVMVDNGSAIDIAGWVSQQSMSERVHVILLGENRGIAAAQNVGIASARQTSADYVILFDHDSNPEPDMVAKLVAVAKAKSTQGKQVASVGPRYRDERQDNPPPFIQIKGFKVERQPCNEACSVVEVDYLIASGCLIPMSTLDAVGGMREEFFIDYVDIEWGLRAKMRGYQSYGACAAYMHHDLGDEPIEFMGRKLPLHSPLRHYYHVRNAVWMYRQDWLPLHWKLADGWRLFLKYGFYTLFAKPRHKHWWMMTKGAWHGLRGCMGKLS